MTSSPRTAILFFSRSAHAEARAKSFGFGQAGDLRVAESLIGRTRKTLARLGLPLLRIDETRQRGGTFGARLDNAIAEAFALGYENLLVVGNDAPTLNLRRLRQAVRALENGHDTLIPDRRGGIALLGLRRVTFANIDLAGLAWETNALRAELQALLPAARELGAVVDLNSAADLRRNWFRLRSLLSGIGYLLFVRHSYAHATLHEALFGPSAATLRGPPALR